MAKGQGQTNMLIKSSKEKRGISASALRSFMVLGLIAATIPESAWAQTNVAPSPSPASVNVNPRRITFDRPGKTSTVSVNNQGGQAGSFDIELIDRVMLPDGQIVPAADAATKPEQKAVLDRLKSAKALLLVTPRRITMAAGAGQAVRVRVSSSADTPPGEYRTHLTITAVPPADTGLTAEQAATQAPGELSFHINSVLGISLPVIVRVGPIDVRAAIEHGSIGFETISADGKAAPVRTAVLSLELVRLGTNSLFGDIEVRGAKEKGGGLPLGGVKGLGVYPEIERRFVKIPLQRVPAAGERIDIVFRDDDTAPGSILSKASLAAP